MTYIYIIMCTYIYQFAPEIGSGDERRLMKY